MHQHTLVERLRVARTRIGRIGAHVMVQVLGVPPHRTGYRWLRSETLEQYFARVCAGGGEPQGSCERVHPETVATSALPRNVSVRDELPKDAGWWGYSFWDVPARTCGETLIARLPDCRIATHIDATQELWPAIVNRDDYFLRLREFYFRSEMAPILRQSHKTQRLAKGTWILERVYDNYAHWFTAHVPKILLLQAEGMLEGLILPNHTNEFVERSLRWLGIDRADFPTFDPGAILRVDELTVLQADQVRPELLRLVQNAFWKPAAIPPCRRVFISRAKAGRRRLANEEEIWPMLRTAGFERICMEDLTFAEQVNLMGETAVLLAPHGAGLTNMMFCAPGTHVVEIMDLSFPNPLFYAVAGALEHHYWLLGGTPIGNGHPLFRDMAVNPASVRTLLGQLLGDA